LLPIVGPGSQEPEEALDFLQLPRGMHTYRPPVLPELSERCDTERVRDILVQVRERLAAAHDQAIGSTLSLAGLTGRERALLDQILGEGEVSARAVTPEGLRIDAQESVFTGVWRVVRREREEGVEDRLEVGPFPAEIADCAARDGARRGCVSPVAVVPDGIMNGPAIVAELFDVWRQGPAAMPHIVNLSLLPFTPADVQYLDAVLGQGSVTILSRGYGNCRITSTQRPATWYLHYYNSQDHLILSTVEVCDVPEVARAAAADFVDSEVRLGEVLSWIAAP
jgi:hydrogenase-1 operon protein HyaF